MQIGQCIKGNADCKKALSTENALMNHVRTRMNNDCSGHETVLQEEGEEQAEEKKEKKERRKQRKLQKVAEDVDKRRRQEQ